MLSKQAKAELQRMIDKGAEHMRQQGQRSFNEDGCAYRGVEGSKCFIGALITDKNYTEELEGKAVQSSIVLEALEKEGYVNHKGISFALGEAQERLHDDLRDGDTFLKDFEEALEHYCNEYGLTYRAPGEIL